MNQKHIKLFISLNIIFTFLYFFFTNISEAVGVLSLSRDIFSFSFKIKLFFLTLFDFSYLLDLVSFILVLLSIISFSLLVTLFCVLWQKTKEISGTRSFISFSGMFLAVLGMSCATCGIGLLASIFSLFGISQAIVYFPLHGQEFGYLGLLTINVMNYILYKRVKSPTTC